jgi:hypothetical protein
MFFSRELVRQLKGPALSVLLLLTLERTPVSQAHIRRHSGYSDEAVSDALAYLRDLGYVTNGPGRYDWRIAIGGIQPPLPAAAEALDERIIDTPVDKTVNNFTEEAVSSGKSGASSGNTGAELNDNKDFINPNEEKIIINSTSSGKSGAADVRRALKAAGIAEPKRTTLANLPHVTERCVRYHTLTAKNIRLAIYQIQHDWPVPADWVDPAEGPLKKSDNIPTAIPTEDLLQPLNPEQVMVWQTSLDQLPFNRAEITTWMSTVPDGVSPVSKEWIIRCANRYGAEWIFTNVKEQIEKISGYRLRLEVPDTNGRWMIFEGN